LKTTTILFKEKFEDTKGVIRSSKSKKERQYNGEKRKDRQYNGEKKKERQYNGEKNKERQYNGEKKEIFCAKYFCKCF
jgi:hypothetical protein